MHYNDPDVERALQWLMQFLAPGEWARRKAEIEAHLRSVLQPKRTRSEATTHESISVGADRIGWYLYLAETALTEIYKCEPTQASRVLPIFKRLGADLDLLRAIGGAEDKVRHLLHSDRATPDPGLFEILVALLWKRNGWPHVDFIPAAPPSRRPDIRASDVHDEWFIECKRLAKSSEYSERERNKWLVMWRHLRDVLLDQHLPYVLEVTFHVELETLPDDFLREHLAGKLRLVVPPCTVISNDIVDVTVSVVDFDRARQHLSKYYVKYPSEQLNELVGGRRDPHRGFTCIVRGRTGHIGDGIVNNQFVDELDFAAGAFWVCDAERAIERKARDIRGHLADAVAQLPNEENSVVHIGLETLDGPLVEMERQRRIVNSVFSFEARGKNLMWVYCHLFQSYSPPDQAWVIDETIHHFGNANYETEEPLTHRATLVPQDEPSWPGGHWLRETP